MPKPWLMVIIIIDPLTSHSGPVHGELPSLFYLYWDDDNSDKEPSVETLPPLIRSLVVECLDGMERGIKVEDIRRKYSALLAEAASKELE